MTEPRRLPPPWRVETNNESLCIRDAKGQALAKRSVALFDTYALCRVTPLGMSAIKPHPKDPPLNDVSDISVARTTVRPSLQGHIEFEINSGTLISRLAMMDRYVPAAGDHQETGYCTHA
jgi:hypothetical protein